MANILLIDDDALVLDSVGRMLRRETHVTQGFTCGRQALIHAFQHPPDLVILDIVMPGIDGITLCRQLRAVAGTARVPVLFLSACSTADDLAEALDAGGDDYLRKPFAPKELAARVRALLRRVQRHPPAEARPNGGRVPAAPNATFGAPRAALRFLPEERTVFIDGRTIRLTQTEVQLVGYMLDNPDALLSSERLLQNVWNYPPGSGDSALVRTHIRNLRRKLEPDPEHPTVVLSMHGRGYILNVYPVE